MHLREVYELPNGLPDINEYLLENFPKLATSLSELQLCAMVEENALDAIAGGWNKKDTNITIRSLEVAAVVGLVFVLGYTIKKARQIDKELEDLDERIKAVEGAIKRDEAELKDIENAKREIEDSLRQAQWDAYQAEKRAVKNGAVASGKKFETKMTTKEKDLTRYDKDNKIAGHSGIRANEFIESPLFARHEPNVNYIFKNLRLPGKAKIKPIAGSGKNEEYIIRRQERDVVKVEINGKGDHVLFYRSTGLAGKDQGLWPKDHWYPVEGVGKDGWFNKFDANRLYYNSQQMKDIAKILKDTSDELNLNTRLLVDSLPGLDSENIKVQEKTLLDLNKVMNESCSPTILDYGDYSKPLATGFRKFLPETFRDRFPNYFSSDGFSIDKYKEYSNQFHKIGDFGYWPHYNKWFSDFSEIRDGTFVPSENLKSLKRTRDDFKKLYNYVDMSEKNLAKLDCEYRKLCELSQYFEQEESRLRELKLIPKNDLISSSKLEFALIVNNDVTKIISAGDSLAKTSEQEIQNKINRDIKSTIHEDKILLKTELDEDLIRLEVEIAEETKMFEEKIKSEVNEFITTKEEGVESRLL